MNYRFSDLADIPKLQELMGSLYWLTDVAIGIIEADGTYLFCAGWRGACASQGTGACDCQKYIASHLDPVSYTCRQCPTGMLHYACPVVVEGKHLASVYIGQFFTEPPDKAAIAMEAANRGLQPEEYFNDLSKITVVPPMRLTLLLKYLKDLSNMLADIGLQRLKQMETLNILRLNEEHLQYISCHDPLTGLLNRNCFEETLSTMDASPALPVGIIILDLDGLKVINDTMGHPAGDALLCSASVIIKDAAPSEAIVARIGGDEFAILLPQTSRDAIEEIQRLIMAKIVHHNRLADNLTLGISIGFAVTDSLPLKMRDLFKEADANMYRDKVVHGQLRVPNLESAIRLLQTLDYANDGHTDRLCMMATALARKLSLSQKEIAEMSALGHFHDIGKTALPETILFKPSPLDSEERQIMERHCEIGHRMARSFQDLIPIANYVLQHHEWWNGKGYPQGLSGDAIPVQSRILSIIDAYDAMTSERPYRPAKTPEEAIAELRRCAGQQFDPVLVEIFVEWILNGASDKNDR